MLPGSGVCCAWVGNSWWGGGPKMLVSFSDPAVTITGPAVATVPGWLQMVTISAASAMLVSTACRSRRDFRCPPFCAASFGRFAPPSPAPRPRWGVAFVGQLKCPAGLVCVLCAWRRKPLWARGHNRAAGHLRRECDTSIYGRTQMWNPATARGLALVSGPIHTEPSQEHSFAPPLGNARCARASKAGA